MKPGDTRPPTPDDPDWSSPNPTPTAPHHPARRTPDSTHPARSDHPTPYRCRAPRCNRYRRAANRDAANARRSTACCAGPLGTVCPLLGPSWLTAEPRTTANTGSPSRSASLSRLSTTTPAALAAHIPVGVSIEGLAVPVREPTSPTAKTRCCSPGSASDSHRRPTPDRSPADAGSDTPNASSPTTTNTPCRSPPPDHAHPGNTTTAPQRSSAHSRTEYRGQYLPAADAPAKVK